jgi:two-component system cell cycle sensor histidine kinase/response regulator CckA
MNEPDHVEPSSSAASGDVTEQNLADPRLMQARLRVTNILVVDDEDVVRRLTHRLLSVEGYRVFEAADAEEALSVLHTARQPIHLVVLDALMPRTNGAELAFRILERWPDQRLLLMSAHPAEVFNRLGLGVTYPFLAKPFTRDELFDKVQQALRHVPPRLFGAFRERQIGQSAPGPESP